MKAMFKRILNRFSRLATKRPATVRGLVLTLALLMLAPVKHAWAENPLLLAIPPFFPEEETRQSFQPLADYLAGEIDQPVELLLFPNYLAFWEASRRESDFDMVLDSAPMTDFRAARQGFDVIARLEGDVTQSLVTHPDLLVVDPEELVNRRVVTQPSPSVSSLTLYQMFPNPIQQPLIQYAESTREAAELVIEGAAEAALIPTPIAAGYPQLNLIMTTEPLPFMAFSVSPAIPSDIRRELRRALLNASVTRGGRQMLEESNLNPFIHADADMYAGESELLRGTYGF